MSLRVRLGSLISVPLLRGGLSRSRSSLVMEREKFLILFLLLLILADQSNATYSIWGLRRLITEANNDNSSPKDVTPLPSPVSNANQPKPSPTDGDKSATRKPGDSQLANDTETSNRKSSNKEDNKTALARAPPPIENPMDSGNNEVKKSKNDGKIDCEGLTEICKLPNKMTACIRSPESGSKGLVLLIQNKRESPLKVNVTLPSSLKNAMDEHVIAQKQTEMINVSSSVGPSSEIVLKAGDDECKLHVGPPLLSQLNFLQQLPTYYKQITPMYIAYFFFLMALVVGGTCVCCQLRKWKKRQNGVPYQELEMGIPESSSAVNVESPDGWDDGWDDDWDYDKAVKPPGGQAVRNNISANGLTVRAASKDGWGKDWND